MKGRFLLPAVFVLTIAALLIFFVSSNDISPRQIEKQKLADIKTSQRLSKQGISTDMPEPDLNLPSRINSFFDDLPKLNELEQEKCAEEIAELSDDNTAVEWSKILISKFIPEAAERVLFNDLLNRPSQVLQPFLAEIADKPEHPLKEKCTEALEFLYDRPPTGNNWKNWVKEKLAEE